MCVSCFWFHKSMKKAKNNSIKVDKNCLQYFQVLQKLYKLHYFAVNQVKEHKDFMLSSNVAKVRIK